MEIYKTEQPTNAYQRVLKSISLSIVMCPATETVRLLEIFIENPYLFLNICHRVAMAILAAHAI